MNTKIRLVAGCAALLAFSAGCGTSSDIVTVQPHPTILEVNPREFLASLKCGTDEGALQRYVATLTDVTRVGEPEESLNFDLPSSAPARCGTRRRMGARSRSGWPSSIATVRCMPRASDTFRPGASCVDASNAVVALPGDPRRIVSLVPSVTETLFALGLGDRVVGVTEWCIHPRDLPPRVARVRGTKNPDCAAIARLAPDLVLANHEENREIDVRRLRERGVTVWVDYPRTVREALDHVRGLARLGASAAALHAVTSPIESALARRAERTRRTPVRAFIAVWKDPWMTLSRDTYANDVLACAGIGNVFGDAAERYPRVTLEDVAARDPELILLPDEPYRFGDEDARELQTGALAGSRALRSGNVHVVDGTLPFWHGPRIARALEVLGELSRRAR